MNLGLWHCRQIILPSEPPGKPLVSFPCGLSGKKKNFSCNVGDLGSFSGLGRSPGEGKGYPLQSSGLENFMDCMVHGITKSRIRLSNFHFHYTLFYTVVLFLVWTHGDWFLQLYSSFSKILWLSGAFYVFTHIFKKLCPSSMENGFGNLIESALNL